MSIFRSPKDIAFIKRMNQELIEKVIGEKITYYAISHMYSSVNFYGESKEKVFDPPIEIYALVEWQDQKITTTEFGQDTVYNLKVSILQKHLKDINIHPYEGDMVEYSGVKFEITSINTPGQIFGKAYEDIGVVMQCVSIRESAFKVTISGAVDQQKRTAPDNQLTASLSKFSYGDARFPFSSSL